MKCLLFPLHFSSPSLPLFTRTKPKPCFVVPQMSFSAPRRRRSRRSRPSRDTSQDNPNQLSLRRTVEFDNSPDSPIVKLVLDLDRISSLSSSIIDNVVSFSSDALQDLRTLVQIDPQTRTAQLSCRKSTLQFLAAFITCGFVIVFTFRLLVKLGLGVKARFSPKPKVIVRRDRSLGGKEVIVGIKRDGDDLPKFRALDNPLSLSKPSARSIANGTSYPYQRMQPRVGDKLPKWWPQLDSLHKADSVSDSEYHQSQANKLIREIIDNRLAGKDFTEEDIIQLRRICRTSGVRVSIDTANTRDSLYRASIEFVLNVCCSASCQSNDVEIDGEDARKLLAGLAENVGLDSIRAATMVSAGVAGRTRFCFLQAWAYEMQGKHTEATLELSKICLVHQIFPPEKSSPEMEMVARGLEKVLKVEQRELLMGMLVGVCNDESRRSAAEALGLVC